MGKYKPTGRPVGRPESDRIGPGTHDLVSKKGTFYRKAWEDIYATPVLKDQKNSVDIGSPDDPDTLDLRELYSPQSKFTPEEKLYAATAWVMTGSIKEASRLTGIKERLLKKWKSESLWWDDAVREIRKRKQEELEGHLSELIHQSTALLRERIETGNPYLTRQGGELKWVPLTTRDLLFILSQTFDKRALIRGDPTSRTERVSSEQRLEKLQQKMLDAYAKLRDETSKIEEGKGKTFDNENDQITFDENKVKEEILNNHHANTNETNGKD